MDTNLMTQIAYGLADGAAIAALIRVSGQAWVRRSLIQSYVSLAIARADYELSCVELGFARFMRGN